VCDPVTLATASIAIGGVQSVVGYVGAQQQYKAQTEVYSQNAENSAHSASDNYKSLNIRLQQEGAAAADEKQANELERAQAIATAQTAADAGGVTGLSLDAVVRDIYSRTAANEVATDANLRMSKGYLQSELKSANNAAQSQINSMPIPEKPSAIPYLLQGFSSGISGYSQKLKLEK
jgi:hypothetical protein